jgi:SAM-dependent methyltransferase
MNEQERFLRAFHRRHPGVTSRAYRRARSYDVLARFVRGRTLDLGCGDRVLGSIGVDLSEAELVLAREHGPVVQARAQALPFRDGAFDTIVSHLAFTLMTDIEAVVAELARVIAPGGRFVTVVGGGPRGDDAFAGFLELARPWMTRIPRLGDLRARSDAGLHALFADGWTSLTIDDLPVDLSGTPDDVFETLASAYELDGADRQSLRAAFATAAPRWTRDDGSVNCTMATRLVTVVRAG